MDEGMTPSARDREMARECTGKLYQTEIESWTFGGPEPIKSIDAIAAALAQARAEEREKLIAIIDQLQEAAEIGERCCTGESYDDDAKTCRDAVAAAIRARGEEGK